MHECRKKFILSICFALFIRICGDIIHFRAVSAQKKTPSKIQKKSLYKLCSFYYNSTCGSGL